MSLYKIKSIEWEQNRFIIPKMTLETRAQLSTNTEK